MYEFEKKNDKILIFDREKTNTTVFDVWLLPFRLLEVKMKLTKSRIEIIIFAGFSLYI